MRLPPYHCVLNPFELIWAQIKGSVARNNKTYKLGDVKLLLANAIKEITTEKWRDCVAHVIKEEEKLWELECVTDKVVDSMVINTADSSSSKSESDMEGVEPLLDSE